ncbi:MAG TPA: branched-chain amino acid ABC transporter permease [Stellaceae bacterium]|nr:branched-chain amino acid ABC transporter permease [Stellaceae bacterium]
MTLSSEGRRHIVALALFAGALAARRFSGYAGADLLGEIAVWAIFAMSLDLIAGYAGLVSLGHALFFGLGAYAMASLTLFLKWPPAMALPMAVIAAGVAGFLVGAVVVRLRGVFFIMITLAFGQMGWAYFLSSRSFGGFGGMSGVSQLDLSALGLTFANPKDFALFAVVVAGIVYVALARVVASPFGHMLVALHQNESRARALGLPVTRYKLAAFTLAAALAGLAGTLQTQRTGFVSPELLVWTSSGEVLIMVIVGGLGSLVGPVGGAAVWVVLRHYLSEQTPYWMLVMGLFFVAVVLFAGDGLMGVVGRATTRRRLAAEIADDV